MPEFILDTSGIVAGKTSTGEIAITWRALDAFTQGYIEALFFTDEEQLCEESNGDHEMPGVAFNTATMESRFVGGNSVSFADLAPVALARIIADCAKFQEVNAELLAQAKELEPGSKGFRHGREALDDRRLGNLFHYARNGHGVAFTDDGHAPCLEALQAACGYGTAFCGVDSYMGDDGLIYLM